MKDRDKIIIAVAVSGGAFLIWKNWDKISEMFKKKDATEGGEPKKDDDVNKGGGTGDSTQVSSFKQKVMALQELLQVGVDGDAGEQTNGKLDYMWADYGKVFDAKKSNKDGYPELKARGKGVVSADNVDYYINTLKSNKSPRQNYWAGKGAAEKATADFNARKAFGQNLFSLGASGKKVSVKSTTNAPIYIFDASRNVYTKTSDTLTLNTYTHLFSFFEIAGYNTDGYFILKRKSFPKEFIIVNPYIFQAT